MAAGGWRGCDQPGRTGIVGLPEAGPLQPVICQGNLGHLLPSCTRTLTLTAAPWASYSKPCLPSLSLPGTLGSLVPLVLAFSAPAGPCESWGPAVGPAPDGSRGRGCPPLAVLSPPRAGPGLSLLLSGAPGPSPSPPGSDPGGSWLGLVQKKDYPDQSLLISSSGLHPPHTHRSPLRAPP